MASIAASFPSAYRSVTEARKKVAKFARSCGLPDSEVFDIILATGEACNNAVEHGHAENAEFTVTCYFDGSLFTVTVADKGAGFDATGRGLPMDPRERDVRGLGIYIMRALMDEVQYARKSDGTAVQLVKRRPEAGWPCNTSSRQES